MSLEQIVVILRVVILIGSVLFAFALLIFGFHIVLREYKNLNTWPKMKEFLSLTANSDLKADVAKGAISLSRTTPGILLIAIGTIIIALCIFQKLEYASHESAGAGNTKVNEAGIQQDDNRFNEQVSQALQDLDKRVTILEAKGNAELKKASLNFQNSVEAFHAFYSHFVSPQPSSTITTAEQLHQQLSIPTYFPQDSTILRKWLSSVPEIKGKVVTDQLKILLGKHGDVSVKRYSVLLDQPKPPIKIAEEEYGSTIFAPLLLSFNPRLPQDGKPIPKYTHVAIYTPATAPESPYRRDKLIKIDGMGRAQLYDHINTIIEGILRTPEYKANPAKWWKTRYPVLGQVEFAKSLESETGRQWGIRVIPSEEGESLELLAKIHYGARKHINILKFLNYTSPKITKNTKAPLPVKTNVVVLQLMEF